MPSRFPRVRLIPFTIKAALVGVIAGSALAFGVATGIYNLIELSQQIRHQRYEQCLQLNSAHDQSVRYINKISRQQIADAKKAGKDTPAFEKQERTGVREYYVLFGLEFPKRNCKHING